MKIALVQTDLFWEDPKQNIKHFSTLFSELQSSTDLVVLPEMFTTGFTMNPQNISDTEQEDTLKWMHEMAQTHQVALTGSIIYNELDRYYNRLYFITPQGETHFYNKRHLFSLAGEEKQFTAGNDRLIIEYKGVRICPLICYDLRFPVFSRNTHDYDLLLYVASWPDRRISAWDALLKARAIENMSCTIGVNRIGWDANEVAYSGHTQALDALGNHLLTPQVNSGIYYLDFDKTIQDQWRDRFGFLNDQDDFQLI